MRKTEIAPREFLNLHHKKALDRMIEALQSKPPRSADENECFHTRYLGDMDILVKNHFIP